MAPQHGDVWSPCVAAPSICDGHSRATRCIGEGVERNETGRKKKRGFFPAAFAANTAPALIADPHHARVLYRVFLLKLWDAAACGLESCEWNWLLCNMAQFLLPIIRVICKNSSICMCVKKKRSHSSPPPPPVLESSTIPLPVLQRMILQRPALEWWASARAAAAGVSCVWSLMKDPLLHEKSSAVVEGERERERGREGGRENRKPLLGFARDQYKRERWG